MRFHLYAPHPLLSPYVQAYWTIDSAGRPIQGEPEVRHLHPDGGHGITVNLAESVESDRTPRPYGVSLGSELLAPTTLRFEGIVRMVGIRFRPHGSYRFFGAARLAEGVIAPSLLQNLLDLLERARTAAESREVAECWLMRLGETAAPSPVIGAVLREITARSGAVRIDSLAAGLDSSPRRIERLFREQVGYSPSRSRGSSE